MGFLSTPSIWIATEFDIPQFEFPTLDLTKFNPTPIPQKLRLGHQMEFVCKQLLDESDDYEVLIHNLPIRKKKQTIGEIDYIIRKISTQQLIHVELTYKFYLIDTEIPGIIHQLIGPNKRDSFFTKLQKIKNNQFSLIHSEAGHSTLSAKGIDTYEMLQQTLYKAQLYVPWGHTFEDIQPLNSKCIIGYWLRLSEFHSHSFSAYQFYIPTKNQWVIKPHLDTKWSSFNDVLIIIKERLSHQSSPMVWMKINETKIDKIFIVWW